MISSARNLICADCWLTALSGSERVPARVGGKPAGRQFQHPGATLVSDWLFSATGIAPFSNNVFLEVFFWGGAGG